MLAVRAGAAGRAVEAEEEEEEEEEEERRLAREKPAAQRRGYGRDVQPFGDTFAARDPGCWEPGPIRAGSSWGSLGGACGPAPRGFSDTGIAKTKVVVLGREFLVSG